MLTMLKNLARRFICSDRERRPEAPANSNTVEQRAVHCGTEVTIVRHREELDITVAGSGRLVAVSQEAISPRFRIGRDGRTIDTSRIGRSRQRNTFCLNEVYRGLPRTNADKLRAVRAALVDPATADKSNGVIADHCGVSEKTVRKYRSLIDSQNG